jgi:hypothetical protein
MNVAALGTGLDGAGSSEAAGPDFGIRCENKLQRIARRAGKSRSPIDHLNQSTMVTMSAENMVTW